MSFFDDLGKKVKDVAYAAGEKTRDAADLAKISMAIAGEQREMDKNLKAIGQWFVDEYSGEIPEAVRTLVEAVGASREKIAGLEASKPKKADPEPAPAEADGAKACPICGAVSDSKFCPQCGAPRPGPGPGRQPGKPASPPGSFCTPRRVPTMGPPGDFFRGILNGSRGGGSQWVTISALREK